MYEYSDVDYTVSHVHTEKEEKISKKKKNLASKINYGLKATRKLALFR